MKKIIAFISIVMLFGIYGLHLLDLMGQTEQFLKIGTAVRLMHPVSDCGLTGCRGVNNIPIWQVVYHVFTVGYYKMCVKQKNRLRR